MFNKSLKKAYKDEKSIERYCLNILKYELTWTKEEKEGKIEKRVGIHFDEINPNLYLFETDFTSEWYGKSISDTIEESLNRLGVKDKNLEEYIKAGKKAVETLNFPYYKFSTEKVRAYMNVSEDQYKTFPTDLHDLVIGNLSERAMHELLIKENKKFKGRSFLVYNSDEAQEEKDIKIFEDEDIKNLGVRCQRILDGNYLYSKKRVFKKRDKIGDYIVFFNHFAHHIFYITGIVEKDFLQKAEPESKTSMEPFPFPEKEDIYEKEALEKRLKYEEFMNKLDSL